MACPAFYPTLEAEKPLHTSGRLPLIDEYSGLCKSEANAYVPDRDTLFRCCNHGYSQGACSRLPLEAARSSVRYSVLKQTDDVLEILCVEETDYEPRRWHRLEYLVVAAEINGAAPTECIRAQAAAFCLAYVRHFLSIDSIDVQH